MKFLNRDLHVFKSYLNLIQKNAILQVHFLVVSKDLKANVVLLYQQMQRLFEFLKKTVMRGYSCINTRMTFDTEIFLKDPKNEKLFLKLKMDNSNDSHPESLKWMRTISMVWQ